MNGIAALSDDVDDLGQAFNVSAAELQGASRHVAAVHDHEYHCAKQWLIVRSKGTINEYTLVVGDLGHHLCGEEPLSGTGLPVEQAVFPWPGVMNDKMKALLL